MKASRRAVHGAGVRISSRAARIRQYRRRRPGGPPPRGVRVADSAPCCAAAPKAALISLYLNYSNVVEVSFIPGIIIPYGELDRL